MNSKYEKMIENLKSLGSVAVAFSGGVDSTFLLRRRRKHSEIMLLPLRYAHV